jgi:hypothetical protein
VCLCVLVGIVFGYLCLFVVVYYNVEDRVVYVCAYVIDVWVFFPETVYV